VDYARERFQARQSIEGALAEIGMPGVVVTSTRAVGMEVETANGLAGQIVDTEAQALWPVLAAVGTDGSVRGAHPVEYRCLPQRGARVEYAISSLHARLAEAGYDPDASAGVHMHVDASDLTAEQVWRAFAGLVTIEAALFALADPARATNSYCVGYGENAPEVIRLALQRADQAPDYFDPNEVRQAHSRYMAVNSHAYSGHSTLEVRVFDSKHDAEARERYTLAAALITATVDFASSAAGQAWLNGNLGTLGTEIGVFHFINALVSAGVLVAGAGQRISQVLTDRLLGAA
jgi:hypothetical protein